MRCLPPVAWTPTVRTILGAVAPAGAALLALALLPGLAAQPGITQLEPIGAFLDGRLPAGTPGTVSQATFVDAFPSLRFDQPITFTPEPRSNRIHVGSRAGVIESFVHSPVTTTKTTFLTLPNCVVVWDGGLLGHAFHPDWGDATSANRNYFYVYYCYAPPGATDIETQFRPSQRAYYFNCFLRLSRFERNETTGIAVPGSELVMLQARLYNGSHRGGGLFFGPDGYLYLSIGDQFRYETAQRLDDNFEGGVIRIDVDQGPGSHAPLRVLGPPDPNGNVVGEVDEISGVGYAIPDDNPFLDASGGRFEEFWTVGHRNPHRMTLDPVSGDIWSGEVGQNDREEINLIVREGNYQWPFREGTLPFTPPDNPTYTPPSPLLGVETPPILDFPRAAASALIGGYVYRGTIRPELVGDYICGDYASGRIFAVTHDPQAGTASRRELFHFTPGALATFGQDLDGEIYLCGLGEQVPIYKIESSPGYVEAATHLSDLQLFTDLTTLEPPVWLVPYDVNAPLWSDGLIKRRWLAVPNDGVADTPAEQIGYSDDKPWSFPVGTVLVKHFETPTGQRVETRLFVHGEDTWYGITYRWNANGDDATLLSDSASETLTVDGATFDYHYPSRSECLQCHNENAGFVNGLRSRQLNRDFAYPLSGNTDNQVVALDHVGLLSPRPVLARLDREIKNVGLGDVTASLEHRVRSYLDGNCAQCHRPGNGRTPIDARSVRALPWQSLVDGAVNDDLGIADARVVAPGDPARSILHERINRVGTCCDMPPLGRGRIHHEAVDQVRAWIEALDPAAVAGSVSQSSTWVGPQTNFHYAAPLVVDGNADRTISNFSVSLTNLENEPFWDADFGAQFDVESIRIWNSEGGSASFLNDFDVFLSPTPFASTSNAATRSQPGVIRASFAGQAEANDVVSFGGARGRYLRVQIPQTTRLILAEVWIDGHTPNAGPPPRQTTTVRTAARAEDAEESLSTSSVVLNSIDLELGAVAGTDYLVGVRVPVDIPAGATITSASLQFTVDEVSTGAAQLSIAIEDSDDAAAIANQSQDLSGRPRAAVTPVSWQPAEWLTVAEQGDAQRTPELAALIQHAVDRPGWVAGNHVLLLIEGTGRRTAESFDGAPSDAPLLSVEYVAEQFPPLVDAGTPRTEVLGTTTSLAGSFADADSAAPSVLWEQIRGPVPAVIDQPDDPTSTVTFPNAGIYELRLTVDDGTFSRSDTVTIAVTPVGGVTGASSVVRSIDDAERRRNRLILGGNDLELGYDGARQQIVGVRIPLAVPAGATITQAQLVFTADGTSSGIADLEIRAVLEDDAVRVGQGAGLNLVSRNLTADSVAWSVPDWQTPNGSGQAQTSPNLAALLQQVVDRPAWSTGNHVLLLLRGTGTRRAFSFDGGGSTTAPLLRVSWE